jgi:hypothetical protein
MGAAGSMGHGDGSGIDPGAKVQGMVSEEQDNKSYQHYGLYNN